MPTLLLPSLIHIHARGRGAVHVVGSTVFEALVSAVDAHPRLRPFLLDAEGSAPSCVAFRDGERLGDPASAVRDGDTILVELGSGSLLQLGHEEVARYSRHLILDEVGVEGQRRLKSGSVLCVGTGGLGSPLLMYLAAAGVGRIGIVDFDVVDHSNLQRQVVHSTKGVGRKKVLSAADRIRDINPNVQVDVYDETLTSDNALRICEPYDVIVDGTDNFPTRYLVNDACVLLGKPNVYGSIFKFEGQASVFNYRGGPNYRDLYPNPPPPGMVPSCAEGGVLGILPGVIGVIQATETVKILLGLGSTLSGRLLLYDALHMRFHELTLNRDPDVAPITALVDYDQFCGLPGAVGGDASRTEVPSMRPSEVVERRATGWNPFVLDVRRIAETRISSLSFVDRVWRHDRVGEIADELPRDRDILVHCKAGSRSAKAAEVLWSLGFERVINLEGGINAWARDIDPTLPEY